MLVFGYSYNCAQKPSFFHFIFKLKILCKKKIENRGKQSIRNCIYTV